MTVEQFTGEKKVIASGMLLSYEVQDEMRLVIHLDEEGVDLDLRWKFGGDVFQPKIDIYRNGHSFVFTCSGFYIDEPEKGMYYPVSVYSDENKEYILRFIIYGVGDVTRKLEYSLYEVRKDA